MTHTIPSDFRDLCHYIVPHNSPINMCGPFDRHNRWEHYSSRRKIPTHDLTRVEHQISGFFVEHNIPYQFHKRAGIFYAPLKWRQVLELRDQFECDVRTDLTLDMANILTSLEMKINSP